MDSLKVGVIGGGKIAETHIPYIRAAGGNVVAVADVSVAAANDLADRFAVQRIHRSVEDLIAVERPDVVHVLTPPHTHADVAVAALERGVHALVEKPLAIEPAEIDRMAAAARNGRATLAVDHNRLFDPVMLEARNLVDSGALGDIVAIESYQAGSASARPWLGHLRGGGLGDLVPHPLYLQLAFLGPVRDLRAVAFGGDKVSGPEELRVLMQGDGRTGVLTISTRARPELNTLKLCGTKMTIEVNLNNMTLVRRREYGAPKVIGKSLPNIDESYQLMSQLASNTVNFVRGKIRYYPGMKTLIARFYDSIRSGGEPPVGIAEGGDVVRITQRIWAAVGDEQAGALPVAMEA